MCKQRKIERLVLGEKENKTVFFIPLLFPFLDAGRAREPSLVASIFQIGILQNFSLTVIPKTNCIFPCVGVVYPAADTMTMVTALVTVFSLSTGAAVKARLRCLVLSIAWGLAPTRSSITDEDTNLVRTSGFRSIRSFRQ